MVLTIVFSKKSCFSLPKSNSEIIMASFQNLATQNNFGSWFMAECILLSSFRTPAQCGPVAWAWMSHVLHFSKMTHTLSWVCLHANIPWDKTSDRRSRVAKCKIAFLSCLCLIKKISWTYNTSLENKTPAWQKFFSTIYIIMRASFYRNVFYWSRTVLGCYSVPLSFKLICWQTPK